MLVSRVSMICKSPQRISWTRIRNVMTFQREAAKFFQKHAKQGSPQSPYMLGLSYKFQITTVLSLSHRISGLGLGVLIYGLGITEILLREKNFEQILNSFNSKLSSFTGQMLKIFLGTALAFHTFNGVRHLLWDMGYGFTLPKVYLSGYIV
ncbi:hypothetical protein SSS_09616 [Sarcoptes scabiei]|nr:hypothetical protein SSS_09616 [Sarcoptes scabiei]